MFLILINQNHPMKTAIAYLRISTEEQSNFSIEGQLRHITEYCERHNIQLTVHYADEGYSGKNFKRPGWIELRKALQKNKGQITYLIVYKYDRLIRNALEGLTVIHDLEQKHKLTIVSVCENLMLDPHSPFFKKFRADILVNAEFERDVISDRVRFGMNQAMRSGRYLHQAPFGYINSTDSEGKPAILIHPENSAIIQQIFQSYSIGHSMVSIFQQAKAKGIPFTGKSIINKILRNPLYAGLVRVTAFRGEQPKLVKGIHQPLVNEQLWWAIQSKLDQRSKVLAPKITSEVMPLRGLILCENGHQLTGCMCTGKSGKKWPYYKCPKCKSNHSAIKAHAELLEILKAVTLNDAMVQRLKNKAGDLFQKRIHERDQEQSKLLRAITSHQDLIRSIEEKFLRDAISEATYHRHMTEKSAELTQMQKRAEELSDGIDNLSDAFTGSMKHIANMAIKYDRATVHQKQIMLRLLFPMGLTKLKSGYQTPKLAFPLTLNATEHGLLVIKGDAADGGTPFGGPEVFQIKPLLELLKAI